ncbi:unnamed protein product, partial [Rotaria magnacalcarata]
SCYNAFSIHDDLETVAIDIAPADEVVLNAFLIKKFIYQINLVSASD